MSEDKRQRGRPHGSGKVDDHYLNRVADLMVANNTMRVTTAIRQVIYKRGNIDKETSDDSLVRRLQSKWKVGKEAFLAHASERARTRVCSQTAQTHAATGFVAAIAAGMPDHTAVGRAAAGLTTSGAFEQLISQSERMLEMVHGPSRVLEQVTEAQRRIDAITGAHSVIGKLLADQQRIQDLIDPPYLRNLKRMGFL